MLQYTREEKIPPNIKGTGARFPVKRELPEPLVPAKNVTHFLVNNAPGRKFTAMNSER